VTWRGPADTAKYPGPGNTKKTNTVAHIRIQAHGGGGGGGDLECSPEMMSGRRGCAAWDRTLIIFGGAR
jgi:hypothetical protein